MKNKFTPFFILFIFYSILISILLYPFLYELFKPFGKQIFGTKEAMWTALGVFSVIITFFIGIYLNEVEKRNNTIKSIKLLKEEIINNIETLFTGEVERPASFEAFENVKRNLIDSIRDVKKFEDMRRLYDELKYYQEILKTYWHSGRQNGTLVTEKQFLTCRAFIKYFDGIDFLGADTNAITRGAEQISRDLAIRRKEANFEAWKIKLENNVNEIFKI